MVRLVHGVEDVAREVERQVAGEAVAEASLVDVDHAAAFVVGIEQVDASGISLGGVHVVVAGKRQAGGDAAPSVDVRLPGGRAAGQERIGVVGNPQLTDFPTVANLLEDGQRRAPGSQVGGYDLAPRGADGQSEGPWTGGVLFAEWRNDPATG